MSTKFHACSRCWEHECEPTPGSDATRFNRTVTQTMTEYGTELVTIDEDGDVVDDGDIDWHDSESNDDLEYTGYSCVCCGHTYSVLDVDDELVTLVQRDDGVVVAEDEYDEDDDEEDDSVVATKPVTTGRYIDANVTSIADLISEAAQGAAPDTREIEIVFVP